MCVRILGVLLYTRVSAYYYICVSSYSYYSYYVLILLYICVSAYQACYYICVLFMHVCPHTRHATIYVSSYSY